MKWIALVTSMLATCASLEAQEVKLTYDDHVLPILENACNSCHNPDKKKGDLDLTTYRGLMAGSSGGKIVIAGEGDSSKIFTTSAHTAEPYMPPKGDRLGIKEINLIREWIDAGLLETKDSKAKKNNTPKINFSQIETNKPQGDPPIPQHLSTDPVIQFERPGFIADIESSPWAPVIAITSQKQVLLYHTGTLDLIGVLPFTKAETKEKGNPESLSFHPSGKYLLAGGGIQGKSGVTVTWDLMNGEELMSTGREYDSVIASSLRADLRAVATSGPSRLIKMWLTEDNSLETKIKKHTDWVTAVSYSQDGVLLATADRNGGLHIWESDTGNPFHALKGHMGQIVSLKWSADSNYLASAAEDGKVMIWNMNSGAVIKKLDAHKAGILDMDWSSQGELITVGRDYRVKLWKSNYQLKKEIKYGGAIPMKVEWSHDSARFVTVDYKGNIVVWDSKSFERLGNLKANPKPLKDRIVEVENVLNTELKILGGKQERAIQKTGYVKAHDKRMRVVLGEEKAAGDQISKAQQELKQHDLKIKQLNSQQKVVQGELNKLNGPRHGMNQKVKQASGKVVSIGKQIKVVTKSLLDSGKKNQKLDQQLKQVKIALVKNPEHEGHQQRLVDLNAQIAQLKLERGGYQAKLKGYQKQEQSADKEKQKWLTEQQALDTAYQSKKQQIDTIHQEKKSLYGMIKKKQVLVVDQRKIVVQKKKELGELKKKSKAILDQQKKADTELAEFSKKLEPLRQKLERLKVRR